jgi:hypothetical protein
LLRARFPTFFPHRRQGRRAGLAAARPWHRGRLHHVPAHASDDYLREKLNAAVGCLATSAEPIQHRIQAAWNGALGRLTAKDFTDADERERFERIHANVTKLNAPGDVGQVAVSTAAIADERAEKVARDIVELRAAVVGRALRRG